MSIIDIEKELMESLANEMRKTMDFEVLCELLIPEGYTRFEIDYGSSKTWFEVMEWVANTATGEYREHNGTWLFENTKDATMFKLKWL